MKERKKRKRSNRPGQAREKAVLPIGLDEQLVQWVLEMRDLQVAISTEMLLVY